MLVRAVNLYRPPLYVSASAAVDVVDVVMMFPPLDIGEIDHQLEALLICYLLRRGASLEVCGVYELIKRDLVIVDVRGRSGVGRLRLSRRAVL